MSPVILSLALLTAAAPPGESSEKPETLLYVRTIPSGAKIRLDGRPLGTSNGLFSVEPGPHKIVVGLEAHRPQEQKITIRDGRIKRVEFHLDRLPGAKRERVAWKQVPDAKWIDVLGLVDLDRDRVGGTWRKNRGGLLAMDGWHSRVLLPIQIEGGYDLEVELTRVALGGSRSVNIIFPVGKRNCGLVLGGWHEWVHGLQTIDGRDPIDEKNPTTVRPGKLVDGRRYNVLIAVRPQGKDVRIEVSLDDERLINWFGKQASLDIPGHWKSNAPRRPALGMNNCTVQYYTARVRLASGKASMCAPPSDRDDAAIDASR